MDRLNKIVKILLALSLIFLNLTPSLLVNANIINRETTHSLDDDYQSIREHIIAELGYDFYVNHSHSLSQINEFYNLLPMNRFGEILYPENFGGLFIDDDGNLVVLQVGSTADTDLISRFSDGIKIQNVAFSFNEIMAVHRHLTYLFVNSSEFPSMSNVAGSWTDVVNNRLVVYLHEYTEELITDFKMNVIDSPLIAFYQYVSQNIEALVPYFDADTDSDESDFIPIESLNESPDGFESNPESSHAPEITGPVLAGEDYISFRTSPARLTPGTWRQVGSHWYFYQNGRRVSNMWVEDAQGRWFRIGPNQRMLTGWFEVSAGRWFFLNPASGQANHRTGIGGQGAMHVNWSQINGHWYFFNPRSGDPAHQTGIGGEGVMRLGWLRRNGNYYFLNPLRNQANHRTQQPPGSMFHSGAFTINGVQQQFNASGRWTGQVNNITIMPGDAIHIGGRRGPRCSVGFRATNGRNGFVTAAHCGANNSRVYNASGQHVGTIRSRFLANIDAAFVEINSNVTVTSNVDQFQVLNATAATPAVGQLVSSRGTVTGLRSGRVEQINFNTDVNETNGNVFHVVNTTVVNFRSAQGDSGGVAFSAAPFQNNIQGIFIAFRGTQSVISRTSEITFRTGWRLN